MQQLDSEIRELADSTNSLLAMALWNVEWLVKTHGGTRSVPAFDFLLDQPSAVRMQLLAIVDAVRTTGPEPLRESWRRFLLSGLSRSRLLVLDWGELVTAAV
jgi:hypothetical protein